VSSAPNGNPRQDNRLRRFEGGEQKTESEESAGMLTARRNVVPDLTNLAAIRDSTQDCGATCRQPRPHRRCGQSAGKEVIGEEVEECGEKGEGGGGMEKIDSGYVNYLPYEKRTGKDAGAGAARTLARDGLWGWREGSVRSLI